MKVYVAMMESVSESPFRHYLKDVIKLYGKNHDVVIDELSRLKGCDVSIDDLRKHNSICLGVFKSKQKALKACSDWIAENEHDYIKNDCDYDIVKHRYGTCFISETVSGITVECVWVEKHYL